MGGLFIVVAIVVSTLACGELGNRYLQQALLLVVGFGAIKPRPMAVGDEVQVRPSCWISLSADHRIVDGAAAAQFMGALVNALEHPDALAR